MSPSEEYDYIIAGAGCAGLSLALQLSRSDLFFDKILIIDSDTKAKNDRTWCFWEKENDRWYEPVVNKSWNKLTFADSRGSLEFDIHPFRYKMVRGIDYYSYCLEQIKSDPRFEFVNENVVSLGTDLGKGVVVTNKNVYRAGFLFNSVIRLRDTRGDRVSLVQHFAGWKIVTGEDRFDETSPLLMDFSVDQKGDCRFVYIIPYDKRTALIEYTGFSKRNLPEQEYETELKNYISAKLGIAEYKILETERGEIPMTEENFLNPFGARVYNIGVAGGSAKPSSGYTFLFIQRRNEKIISMLGSGKLDPLVRKARYSYYDSIFLNVMAKGELTGEEIFSSLFRKVKIEDLLAFLNEESSVVQDLAVIRSMPAGPFARAALDKAIGFKAET